MAISRSQLKQADAIRRAKTAERAEQPAELKQPAGRATEQVGQTAPEAEARFEEQAGTAHQQAESGLLNQQVGARKAPGAMSPLGARLAMMGVAEPEPKAAPLDLASAEAKFDTLVEALHDDPSRIGELTSDFAALITGLDPVVDEKKAALDDVSEVVNKKELQLNWFERNIGLFTPDEVATLRDKRDGLREQMTDARAFRGGARIALRTGASADAEQLPDTWSARLDEAAGKIPQSGQGPARERPLGELIRLHDDLVAAGDRAELAHATAKADVGDFKDEVAWHQRAGWVDWLFGGKSARGELYRTGHGQEDNLGGVADGFDAVESASYGVINGQVNELLKVESGEYRKMRARYDVLKPAHDSLKSVRGDAAEAQRALRDAEHWISRRDHLRRSEPYKQFEMVQTQNPDGTTSTRQVETDEYKRWKSDVDHAERQASWEISSAESAVHDVNRELPRLEQHLRNAGELNLRLPDVDDDITSFFNTFSRWGAWSYEGSQVDDIQRQMGRLEGRLEMFQDRISPEFHQHRDWVTAKIADRRAELRDA